MPSGLTRQAEQEWLEIPEETDLSPEEEKRRLARLALRLADESADPKLRRLLDLAIVADFAREGSSWRGGRLMTAPELRESRAEAWLKVWAHLAGCDVLVMGSRGRRLGDGIAWLVAQVATAPGTHPMDAESAVSWEISPSAISHRAVQSPRPAFTAHLAAARRLAGAGWSEVTWGQLGSATPRGTWRAVLPEKRRAASGLVQRDVAAAIKAARALARGVRGKARMRLDHHMREVVVYLLRRGHGDLKFRGRRRAAQALWGYSPADTTATSDWDDSPEARALRRDLVAADRLVLLARARPLHFK